MKDINFFILARALHVAGVVLWIGGVAFVTTVLLPSLRTIKDGRQRLQLFEQLEGRFAYQARVVSLITGITGFYMLGYMHAWARLLQLQFWWMHLMIFIWAIFTLVLFVLEPLFLHRWFHAQAGSNSDKAFAWLHGLHKLLFTLSLIAVLGAVSGAHGLRF